MKALRTGIIIVFAIGCNCSNAQSSCHLTYSGNSATWEECVARINSTMVIASPPEIQKMSVWCWAASLSLIFTAEGHPISQEQIISQNFDSLGNTPSGDFLNFVDRLNREYTDANGKKFISSSMQIFSTEDAARSLSEGFPILYASTHHAIVQTSMTYSHNFNGFYMMKTGVFWDPAPGGGSSGYSSVGYVSRQFSGTDIYLNFNSDPKYYPAAWSIVVQ